jgi:hypothetical protein
MWYVGGRCDKKEGYLAWAHTFLRVLGYERGSDITEGDITEVRVYKHPWILPLCMATAFEDTVVIKYKSANATAFILLANVICGIMRSKTSPYIKEWPK